MGQDTQNSLATIFLRFKFYLMRDVFTALNVMKQTSHLQSRIG